MLYADCLTSRRYRFCFFSNERQESLHIHVNVTLIDGRIIGVPLTWFPALHCASAEQREQYEIGAGGRSLHWPDLDEDISVVNLLAGADDQFA